MKHLIILSLLLISCEKEYITDPFIGSWENQNTVIIFGQYRQGVERGYDTNYFTWEATDLLRLTWDDGCVKEFQYIFEFGYLILTCNGITYKYFKTNSI